MYTQPMTVIVQSVGLTQTCILEAKQPECEGDHSTSSIAKF
jgi:hypothetical protein